MFITFTRCATAVLVAASLALWLLPQPPEARAASNVYCNGKLTAPYSQCYISAVGTFYFNEALYYGGGTVNVCQRVEDYPKETLYSRRCANNFADSANDITSALCNSNDYITLIAGNNSGNNHTISGRGTYGNGTNCRG